ncbi:MAG: hypothetical protein Tsb009_39580 [Planctomycetaceae bacterium]
MMVGGILGFLIPLAILMAIGMLISWFSGDPTAGGALSFLMIPLAPFVILSGVFRGVVYANGIYEKSIPEKDLIRSREDRMNFWKNLSD